MNLKIFDTLRLQREREDFTVIRKKIEEGVVFHGTNLWILFFAILIACLGLNTNSTAVVIGAMLISPLMGPILGFGVGVAINSPTIIRKSFQNYLFAAAVGLVSSTIYFLISPIREAHSEILARTQPTVYDVLIALCGGFAGIFALSSKFKGNVIPGAAIATALMPPLCTAGYGLATWQLNYFFGAFYLYIINTVFISAATFFTAFFLKFPVKRYEDPSVRARERRLIWTVIIITLMPSIYLGYDLVQQNNYQLRANTFIEQEAKFPNDYLLKKEINPGKKEIKLVFGGEDISDEAIEELKSKLGYYKLKETNLIVEQGFSILPDNTNSDELNQLMLAYKDNESKRESLVHQLDSINNQQMISNQVFQEIRVQYPFISSAVIQPVSINTSAEKEPQPVYLTLLNCDKQMKSKDMQRLEEWLKLRLNKQEVKLVVHYNK
ncbi:MAG: TIGR00341 family protein [Saprospiraceae bacterium]